VRTEYVSSLGVCCDGATATSTSDTATAEKLRCCHHVEYNGETQTCCDATKSVADGGGPISAGGEEQCCAKSRVGYNATKQVCCDSLVSVHPSPADEYNNACCGSGPNAHFDSNKQVCCGLHYGRSSAAISRIGSSKPWWNNAQGAGPWPETHTPSVRDLGDTWDE
jgi:hypothetical protein